MTSAADLLNEVLHDPANHLVRLLYADALEEEATTPAERARAQFIRHSIWGIDPATPEAAKAQSVATARQLMRLRTTGAVAWTRAEAAAFGRTGDRDFTGSWLAPGGPQWRWNAGFIDLMSFETSRGPHEELVFGPGVEAVFDRHPVDEFRVLSWAPRRGATPRLQLRHVVRVCPGVTPPVCRVCIDVYDTDPVTSFEFRVMSRTAVVWSVDAAVNHLLQLAVRVGWGDTYPVFGVTSRQFRAAVREFAAGRCPRLLRGRPGPMAPMSRSELMIDGRTE